jgi:hypothetical protein
MEVGDYPGNCMDGLGEGGGDSERNMNKIQTCHLIKKKINKPCHFHVTPLKSEVMIVLLVQ